MPSTLHFFFYLLFHLSLSYCCISQISTHVFKWMCLEAYSKIVVKKITCLFYICCRLIWYKWWPMVSFNFFSSYAFAINKFSIAISIDGLFFSLLLFDFFNFIYCYFILKKTRIYKYFTKVKTCMWLWIVY
jgi:hypothetical protein